MVRFHEGMGTLVVLAFLALTIVNILQATGKTITWSKQLSFTAAGLLALQYIIGFTLLGSDHTISGLHYTFALVAIVTVGLEHGKAMTQEDPGKRYRLASVFS